jgi:CO/xanthine dehydrogenase Mo-binding subunit
VSATGVTRTTTRGGVGVSVPRPDGVPKVTGTFAFLGDLEAEGMLWGATRRSTVAHGRIVHLDLQPALAVPGVHAVLTQHDVPGHPYQGQHTTDQPVLCDGTVRHVGEPIAVVAADDEETARLAAAAIVVEVEELPPLLDVEEALARGEVFRHARVRHGDQSLRGEVVVEGEYETSAQDQAPLGTEAGLAIPDGAGGVDLWGPTQWTHIDHQQLVACLGLTPELVRVHSVGLGGAFGGREDLSLQTHVAMLALVTGRPVKMVFDRTESFVAHVKRHRARMRYRHEADRDGRLVRVEARLLLDGGAYQTTSAAVVANSTYFALGPYRCPSTAIDGYALRTNHFPSGAMRGFGANQPAVAAEAQMDRLAAELGIDPVELRLRNAIAPGDRMPTTGQLVEGPLPVAEALRTVAAMPLPEPLTGAGAGTGGAGAGGAGAGGAGADGARGTGARDRGVPDPRLLPGGTGLAAAPDRVVRGVGYALALKNLAFSEGFDDYAEARVELTATGAVVQTAAIEVGQGMVTILQQLVRSILGVEEVEVVFVDTGRIGSAGSTSASRQTQMAGNAAVQAATALREQVLARYDGDDLSIEGVWREGTLVSRLEDLARDGASEWVRFRHPGSEPPDEDGQGDLHVDFCVAAQRAVVDVDPELGLVRVVRIDTAQDVGRAINPQQVLGQVEGGIAQGLGMALTEEVVTEEGRIRNASFTDYLLPTILDVGDVEAVLIEEPSPWGPFGAKGMAELPTMGATPAILAAIRDATGRPLTRTPARPQDIAGV